MRLSKKFAGTVVGVAMTMAFGSAQADDDNLVVVELFTSQGCSSCPPADELLARLAKRDDVLPLALHVDYWDYIGWKDKFARPEHTVRQKAYARAAGTQTIYTPQMVIGGIDHVVGTRPMEVADSLTALKAQGPSAELDVERAGDHVKIEAELTRVSNKRILVQLVRFRPSDEVKILRGENAGRTASYTNVVTDWEVITEWNGDGLLSVRAPSEGDALAAVILQETGNGPILAAAVAD